MGFFGDALGAEGKPQPSHGSVQGLVPPGMQVLRLVLSLGVFCWHRVLLLGAIGVIITSSPTASLQGGMQDGSWHPILSSWSNICLSGNRGSVLVKLQFRARKSLRKQIWSPNPAICNTSRS